MNQVQLYVYDLSNGLARQMSLQLTGKQIDGIWHTSIVVFGKEIFYGQGISITEPRKSHHGKPLQVVDMGETAIDQTTFEEYLSEMREHYTADKYHLLEFNCNSFTNDVIGFLTGGAIPSWIKDLPSDFLATPFGAALRPTIDNMYRRAAVGAAPTPPVSQGVEAAAAASPNPQLAASLLQAVASRAAQSTPPGQQLPTPSSSGSTASATSSLAAPIHMATNPSSMRSLLSSHRAVTAFFTSATCGPCKMIEPVFEEIAKAKTRNTRSVAFVKIDMGVGLGSEVAREWDVRVTPTFIFFLDGQKIHEMKGADASELRTQVDLLLFQAFPPHPHQSLSLPAVESLSLNPILFTQVPALDNVLNKLNSFIDATPAWSFSLSKDQIKDILSTIVLPYLKARFPPAAVDGKQKVVSRVPATTVLLNKWAQATGILAEALPPAELFPAVDMWRLALLDEVVGGWAAAANNTIPGSSDPIDVLLGKATSALDDSAKARNYILTVLRMLSNGLATIGLARRLLSDGSSGSGSSLRERTTSFLVRTLLHDDVAVRTAAASLAFNVAAYLQKMRVEKVRNGASIDSEGGDGDWEVEMTSAVIEAIGRENDSEEIVHRLTASLAFLVRLSPIYEEHLAPLLEVLQASEILKGKLVKGGCGENGVTKKEVRRLVTEVAEKLCP